MFAAVSDPALSSQPPLGVYMGTVARRGWQHVFKGEQFLHERASPEFHAAHQLQGTLVLVDVMGAIYHNHFAAAKADDTSPPSTVSGFVSTIVNLCDRLDPKWLCLCMDSTRNARKELEPTYKAGRPDKPPEFKMDIEQCLKAARTLGWPVAVHDGAEADDVIATLVADAESHQLTTYILTGDRDMFQLITERTRCLYRDRDVGSVECEEILHLPPYLLLDFRALTGDTSDNLKGVPGVGPKKAVKILSQFGTLEAFLGSWQQSADITATSRAWLREHGNTEEVLKGRELMRLHDDLNLTPLDLRYRRPTTEKIGEVLN